MPSTVKRYVLLSIKARLPDTLLVNDISSSNKYFVFFTLFNPFLETENTLPAPAMPHGALKIEANYEE